MPRYRRTDRIGQSLPIKVVDEPGPTTYQPTTSAAYTGEFKEITDEVFPDFRKRKARGEILIGDLRMYRYDRKPAEVTIQFGPIPDWGTRTISGDLCGIMEGHAYEVGLDYEADLARMGEVALISATAKMNSAQIMSPEIVRDLGTSLAMIRRPFKQSVKLLKQMHKYRNKRLGKTSRSASKAAAHAWLEYRYGWQPIILDSSTIIEEAHKTRELGRRRLVARSQEKLDLKREDEYSLGAVISGTSGSSYRSVQTRNLRAAAGVIYEVKPRSTGQYVAAMLGLRARDIPATIWEWTPWSFVTDWFVNVGDWLQAVIPDPAVTVKGSWLTTVVTSKDSLTDCKAWINFGPPNGTHTRSFAGAERTSDLVTRVKNPQVTLTPVVTHKPLSLLHSVDAAALSLKPVLGLLDKLKH